MTSFDPDTPTGGGPAAPDDAGGSAAPDPFGDEGTPSGAEQSATNGEPATGQPDLTAQLAERTADLQRLQAEYVNYKRRVERDRAQVRDNATAVALAAMLPVLDDLDRARAHGELSGGFKAVADSLERTLSGLGLVRFGDPGEPFDPRIHEALLHDYDDSVSEPTAQTILQPGYRVGDRVVRPARVAVVEPQPIGSPVTPQAAEGQEPAQPTASDEPDEPTGLDEPGEPAAPDDSQEGAGGQQ